MPLAIHINKDLGTINFSGQSLSNYLPVLKHELINQQNNQAIEIDNIALEPAENNGQGAGVVAINQPDVGINVPLIAINDHAQQIKVHAQQIKVQMFSIQQQDPIVVQGDEVEKYGTSDDYDDECDDVSEHSDNEIYVIGDDTPKPDIFFHNPDAGQ
jgi:hypothetical protein